MAIASAGTLGATANKTSGTSIVHTVTATAEADNIVVVTVAVDNEATSDGETNLITSVDDTQGNSYVKVGEYTNAGAGANDAATVAVFLSKLATALTVSVDSVTAHFAVSKTAKCISLHEFTVASGKTLSEVSSTSLAAGSAHASVSISGLSSLSRLYFRGTACETNQDCITSATTNFTLITGAFTTGASEGSNMSVDGEFRINTSTGETSDPAGVNRQSAIYFFAFEEVDAPVGGDVLDPMGMLGIFGH